MRRVPILLLLHVVIVTIAVGVDALSPRKSSIQLKSDTRNPIRDLKTFAKQPNELSPVPHRKREVLFRRSSKLKGLFGKNTGLASKIQSMEKNKDIAVAVANSPSVKKLGEAAKNDPKFFTKLNPKSLTKMAKDPEVAKVSNLMEKNSVKLTKKDFNSLRSVVAKDPTKAGALKEILSIFAVIIPVFFGIMTLVG